MCIRVDLIDHYDLEPNNNDFYPLFTHFGTKPSAYTYNGKPEYFIKTKVNYYICIIFF